MLWWVWLYILWSIGYHRTAEKWYKETNYSIDCIEYDIPIPDDIINKYLKKDSYIDNISEEDLPF